MGVAKPELLAVYEVVVGLLLDTTANSIDKVHRSI
jgi:hypothetical protein